VIKITYNITLTFLALISTSASGSSFEHTPYSKAQVGYLVHNSSIGATQAGGSTLIMDTGFSISQAAQIGIKSIATGAEDPEQGINFYRLGAGPHILYRPLAGWAIHVSPHFFTETVYFSSPGSRNPDKSNSRRYSGTQLITGWEKILYAGDSLIIAWGGMWVFHKGAASSTPSRNPLSFSSPQVSKGQAQGLSISAEFKL
jgi:hypothetical protein